MSWSRRSPARGGESLMHLPGGGARFLVPLSPLGRGIRGEGLLGCSPSPHPRPLSPEGRGEKDKPDCTSGLVNQADRGASATASRRSQKRRTTSGVPAGGPPRAYRE